MKNYTLLFENLFENQGMLWKLEFKEWYELPRNAEKHLSFSKGTDVTDSMGSALIWNSLFPKSRILLTTCRYNQN